MFNMLFVALARLLGMTDIGSGSATWGLAAIALSGLVVVAACWLAGHKIADPSSRTAVTSLKMRRRAQRTAFLPLRDPDAAGRPRPRAPAPAAAA